MTFIICTLTSETHDTKIENTTEHVYSVTVQHVRSAGREHSAVKFGNRVKFLYLGNGFKLALTLPMSDAQKVWDGVAQWIAAYLYKHKGVVVPGLGTFTLSEWALDTGLGKPLIISRPAFFITETLVQSFTIKQRQVFTANNVACHMIHYGGVAALAGLDRSTVKVCVQEVVQALKRLLWENKNLRLNLGVIGQLTICDKQVSLEYRRELLNKMRDLTEQRRSTIKPVYPWSPKRILE